MLKQFLRLAMQTLPCPLRVFAPGEVAGKGCFAVRCFRPNAPFFAAFVKLSRIAARTQLVLAYPKLYQYTFRLRLDVYGYTRARGTRNRRGLSPKSPHGGDGAHISQRA